MSTQAAVNGSSSRPTPLPRWRQGPLCSSLMATSTSVARVVLSWSWAWSWSCQSNVTAVVRARHEDRSRWIHQAC